MADLRSDPQGLGIGVRAASLLRRGQRGTRHGGSRGARRRRLEAALSDSLWSDRDTTPAAISGALERLLRSGHEDGTAHSPARALNLIIIVDKEWAGEVANRLESVGRFHPSRTITFAVEPGRSTLDARVSMHCLSATEPGTPAPCREGIEVSIGPEQLGVIASIAAPLLLADLPTVIWSPHRHTEAVEGAIEVADAVLVDTLEEPSVPKAIRGSLALARKARVVDLTWLRDAAWRRRLAALFDPPDWRRAPMEIKSVELRHAQGSGMASLLLVGWLGELLGWKPRPLLPHEGTLYAKVRGRRQHVELRIGPVGEQVAPGLESVAIETASEGRIGLSRHAGGFSATRHAPRDSERRWTLLGAPPAEDRVLGRGIREALFPDPTYEGALALTEQLLPEETLL